jgi:ABC-type molybdenum transport system ATPase subunit/photorepair protein PhrA
VDNAHFKTLRWIFNDSLADDQVEEKDELKDKPEDEQEDERDAEKKADRDEKVENEEKREDEAKASARELLLNWMSSRAGIFHISGKLGSGKSTLMKYLCDHDRTKSLLKEWAGKFLRFR